jgi:hypothetical protein
VISITIPSGFGIFGNFTICECYGRWPVCHIQVKAIAHAHNGEGEHKRNNSSEKCDNPFLDRKDRYEPITMYRMRQIKPPIRNRDLYMTSSPEPGQMKYPAIHRSNAPRSPKQKVGILLETGMEDIFCHLVIDLHGF